MEGEYADVLPKALDGGMTMCRRIIIDAEVTVPPWTAHTYQILGISLVVN